MSLPYRQRRRLRHLAKALRGSDPHLTAMLSIFTRLTAGECMPAREQLGPRRRGICALLMRVLSLVARLAAGGASAASARLGLAIAGRLADTRARPGLDGPEAGGADGRPRGAFHSPGPPPVPSGYVTPRGRPGTAWGGLGRAAGWPRRSAANYIVVREVPFHPASAFDGTAIGQRGPRQHG